MSDFKVTLCNLFRARFPYIAVTTYEENRVIDLIEECAASPKLIKTVRKVFTWSQTEGMLDDKMQPAGTDTRQPLRALEFAHKYKDSAIFIFKDFHLNILCTTRPAEYEVIRKLRDMINDIKNSEAPKNLVFVSPSLSLAEELQKDVTILEFSLPTQAEILELLNEMIKWNSGGGKIQNRLTEDDKEKLVKAALGLTLSEAENAFARAMVTNGIISIDDLKLILDEKKQIIKKTGILEFVDSDVNMNDVGGLENIKKWLAKRKNSWLDSAKKYMLPAPKGILITGVPGCGKSLIAKSMATMWELPLLRLDLGRIFSGIVGSSEQNMRRAISTAEAVAPSVLWIDEIEKGFANVSGQGDSGVSSRIFGTFLTWMQDKTEPVFIIATANNIHQLPPEMMRKGRFDEIFFVDLPTKTERDVIFRLHIKKRMKYEEATKGFAVTDAFIDKLTKMTEGFVGSEIESVVVSAFFEAFYEKRAVRADDFIKAVNNTVPLVTTQREQIQALREWANSRAVSASAKEDLAGYTQESKDAPQIRKDDEMSSKRGGRALDF